MKALKRLWCFLVGCRLKYDYDSRLFACERCKQKVNVR